MKTKMEKALEVVREYQIIRPKDLDKHKIPRKYLERLCEKGMIRRISKGLYEYSERQPTEKATIAEVSKKVPQGIICLLSALQIYEVTTQQPHEVWIALESNARRPRIQGEYPVRFIHMSGDSHKEGIEEIEFERVGTRIYSLAKTIADCFKFRNIVGLDVAIEALRESRRKKLVSSDEIWRYAKICRVSKIIQPYMEAFQ